MLNVQELREICMDDGIDVNAFKKQTLLVCRNISLDAHLCSKYYLICECLLAAAVDKAVIKISHIDKPRNKSQSKVLS